MEATRRDNHDAPPGAELWSIKATARKVAYSPQHLYRLIAEGKFPAPVRVGANRVAFVSTEIEAWIASKIAQRDQAGAA